MTPELLPSLSDELFGEAAHSLGCASGNTLVPASRGITLPRIARLEDMQEPLSLRLPTSLEVSQLFDQGELCMAEISGIGFAG